MQAFRLKPEKCWQRYIREVYSQIEGRPQLESLKGAWVVPVEKSEASAMICKYEWLGSMATSTVACYGLQLNGELLGAVAFATGLGSPESTRLTTTPAKTILLARGICVPHAPTNAGSFLVRQACRQAHRDHGWEVFFAYSDSDAGEIGTIYQAVGWKFIGTHKTSPKHSFTSPDGRTHFTSYHFNKKSDTKFKRIGWDGTEPKYAFLTRLGYTKKTDSKKSRWVWFENTNLECRFPYLPYPKRTQEATPWQ
jgi:hypothetical protein